MDYHTILTALHILGVIIGMGGAFTSDAIFFSSIRDEKVTQTEIRFLKLGGRMVWMGLALIIVSGLLLFATDPERYLDSAKFLSKMSIVGVLILNGLIFHLVHIPRFHRHANQHFPSSDEFMRAVPYLLLSGVISTTSWLAAFTLGMWRGIPYKYFEIISAYLLILIVIGAFVIILKRQFIPHFKKH